MAATRGGAAFMGSSGVCGVGASSCEWRGRVASLEWDTSMEFDQLAQLSERTFD